VRAGKGSGKRHFGLILLWGNRASLRMKREIKVTQYNFVYSFVLFVYLFLIWFYISKMFELQAYCYCQ